jgi:hypothetical protein
MNPMRPTIHNLIPRSLQAKRQLARDGEPCPAPPVYRPFAVSMQPRRPNPLCLETRSAPPVYRPQSARLQAKFSRVIQAASTGAAVVATTTTLDAAALVKSFETEVASWPSYKYVYNTGHGGPTSSGTTRTDVVVSTSELATAIGTLKGKTYSWNSKTIKYWHNAQSSKSTPSDTFWDIVFSEDGKSPGFGVYSINYHIKRV